MHNTSNAINTDTRYEFRTTRAIAASFATHEQALAWLQERHKKHPEYAKSLKLFCVTITTESKEIA